jgi:hypothetical protein
MFLMGLTVHSSAALEDFIQIFSASYHSKGHVVRDRHSFSHVERTLHFRQQLVLHRKLKLGVFLRLHFLTTLFQLKHVDVLSVKK